MVGEGEDAAKMGLAKSFWPQAKMYMDEITAVAHDEDGKVKSIRVPTGPGRAPTPGVATVAARKDADDKLVDMGAHGTITGKGAGDARDYGDGGRRREWQYLPLASLVRSRPE